MDFLKQIAPMLATAVAGPLGGAAVKMIGDAIGLDQPTVESVQKAFSTGQVTPEQVQAIKQAEQDFKLKMAEMGFKNVHDMEMLAVQDRADARKREVETNDWLPKTLALLVTVGFFGVLGTLIFYGKPEHGGDALLVMLGSLGSAWGAVISYYYGSSSGSEKKTAMLGSKNG